MAIQSDMKLLICFLLLLPLITYADEQKLFSKDIGIKVYTDQINDSVYVKRKLVWGDDNSSFNVSASTPFPVACTQTTNPWTANIAQFGGNNVVTGTGLSGLGIPRVTISDDSSITNITGTVSLPTGASTSALQTQIDTDLLAFKSANHADLGTLNTSLFQIDTDLLAFKSANHTDLSAISSNQTNGSQKTQQVDASGNVEPTANASTTGTITGSGQSVMLTLPAHTSSSEIQLTGSLVGTVVFESTIDGSTYNPRVFRSAGVLNNLQTSTSTFPSEWRGNAAGMSAFRVRCTSYISGTLTVALSSSSGIGAVFLNAAIPIGGQSVGNTSTANIPASSSFTGSYENLTQAASIDVAVLMNQNGVLHTQFSIDGSTLFQEITYAITANSPFQITFPPGGAQYFRIKLDNSSGANSATVNLQTSYMATAEDVVRLPIGSSTYLTDILLAPLNKSIIAGQTTGGGGGYVNVKVNPSGALAVDTSGSTVTVTGYVTGSVVNNTSITSTPTTITAPANAIGFILEAESTNTANIRWAVGTTASTTVGSLAEPGRDTGFVPLGANISVAAVSGTQTISVQWISR